MKNSICVYLFFTHFHTDKLISIKSGTAIRDLLGEFRILQNSILFGE
jgi:hypothetical protein